MRAADAHREALHAGIRDVHGIDVPDGEVDTAGRTDRAILRSILALADIDDAEVDRLMDATLAASVAAYETGCPPDLTDKVNPGIPTVLEELRATGHTHGLVTGNLHAIALRKLRAAGLGAWFDDSTPGGFGSDAEDRGALPDIAREQAGGVAKEDAVVIGDTPHDIACARTGGVRVVAIATGPFGVGELRDADAVVERAGELPVALSAL